jgi:hypothetical protein
VGRTRASGATAELGRFLIVDSSTGGKGLMDKEPSDVTAGGLRSGNGRDQSGSQPRSAQSLPSRPPLDQHVTTSESPMVGPNPHFEVLRSVAAVLRAIPREDHP